MHAAIAPPVSGTLVLSEHCESRSEPGLLVRRLDAGTSFETKHLHEYCYSAQSGLSHDIASLLGAVRLADRGFTRHHSRNWERELKVEIPVFELQTWRARPVTEGLQECLRYLTGDRWSFAFVKRRRKSTPAGQVHLVSAPEVPRVFVPFSHGLDSYAQTELMRDREKLEIVPIHVNSSRRFGSWKGLWLRSGSPTVPVSSQVNEPRHPEPSFRTRAFIYNMWAAYGAAMSGSRRVLVPENGQGSLGGSLVPLGSEAPHRSCHPGFTVRLARLVHALTGHEVGFEHPGLFVTKGQVLANLARLRPHRDEWLLAHPSCSYDARHAHHAGRKVHCGVCGNCLLRRLAAHAAGLADCTSYKVSDLKACALEDSFSAGKLPREIAAYRDLAFNSVRSMQRLAELAHQPAAQRVWAEIDGLARYQARTIQVVKDDMFGLLQQHHFEWAAFLEHCGPSSWIARLARG